LDAPLTYADRGISHSFLFSACRHVGLPAGLADGTIRVSVALSGKGRDKDFRPVSNYQPVSPASKGAVVLHVVNVHRINLWDDFRTLWTRARVGKRRAVFFSGRSSHCECSCANDYCRKIVLANSLSHCGNAPSQENAFALWLE